MLTHTDACLAIVYSFSLAPFMRFYEYNKSYFISLLLYWLVKVFAAIVGIKDIEAESSLPNIA